MSRAFDNKDQFDTYLKEKGGEPRILIAEAKGAREYQIRNGFRKYEERIRSLKELIADTLPEDDAVTSLGDSVLIALWSAGDKTGAEEIIKDLIGKAGEIFELTVGGTRSNGTNDDSVYQAIDKALAALENAKAQGLDLLLDEGEQKIRVMIVEDQNLVRQLFERTVKESDNYELIYSIRNADLADVYCQKGNVDLILMDVYTDNGANGLAASARIKRSHPEIKIIIITSMPEFSYLDRARAAGVESFVYKELNTLPLLDVMDRTVAGESIYPDRTPEVMIGKVSSYDLSDRELQILKELTSGDSNEKIAERLYISVATVKTHIANIMLKSGFKNRTELAIKARESGLVIKDE